jgi:transcriptional regulator with XRE-family HTH domain
MTQFSLSQRVKELRTRKGISQELLAEETGLSLRTIQRIENDETVPRGDSLKRLAQALNTSPDEIIDWKIQEDSNYLTIMNLAALTFLFFPLLGILIPLILWISKRDKIQSVNELGKSILNFQISWTLAIFSYSIFLVIGVFGGFLLSEDPNESPLTILLPIMGLYLYNIFMIILNTVRVYNKKTFHYKPALQILK